MKSGHYRLVLIEWEDSARPVSEWQLLGDVSFSEAVRCSSVGFLIHDGKDAKALAPNIAEPGTPNAQASGIIRIPTRCITKMKALRL